MKNDDGFTYIEVIVAISIIAFSSFVIFSGISTAIESTDKVMTNNRINNEVILFEYYFRKAVNEIEFNYWDREIDTDSIQVSQEDGYLLLKSGDEIYRFSSLKFESIDVLDHGIAVDFSSDGTTYTVSAKYSSFILGNVHA
jgi:competence protein ComGF